MGTADDAEGRKMRLHRSDQLFLDFAPMDREEIVAPSLGLGAQRVEGSRNNPAAAPTSAPTTTSCPVGGRTQPNWDGSSPLAEPKRTHTPTKKSRNKFSAGSSSKL